MRRNIRGRAAITDGRVAKGYYFASLVVRTVSTSVTVEKPDAYYQIRPPSGSNIIMASLLYIGSLNRYASHPCVQFLDLFEVPFPFTS